MTAGEAQKFILWTLTRADHRIRRADLIRMVPCDKPLRVEAAYEALLAAGEIREIRANRKVFVGLAPKALSWWQTQTI